MKPEQSEQFLIEELFRQSVANKKVSDQKLKDVDQLTGDASTRRYYRIWAGDNSYVVCLDNPSKEGERNRFLDVQNFLESNKVRVPHVYDYQLSRGYLLEEDLGDQTMLKQLATVESPQQELDIYKKIIDIMLSIHNIPGEKVEQSQLFKEKFDYDKLMSEIQFSTKFFIDSFLKISDEKLKQEIHSQFESICRQLAESKMVLTHRDYHSRNLMALKDEFVVIDFQDARMGIPQYDLVSLLEDCYYYIGRENKEKLIEYYQSKVNLNALGQSQSEFSKLYDAMTLQRVFKAIGSFAYIYRVRQDLRYVKYIGYAMERLKDTMFRHEEYSELRKILFKAYYEN